MYIIYEIQQIKPKFEYMFYIITNYNGFAMFYKNEYNNKFYLYFFFNLHLKIQ